MDDADVIDHDADDDDASDHDDTHDRQLSRVVRFKSDDDDEPASPTAAAAEVEQWHDPREPELPRRMPPELPEYPTWK